MPAISVVVPTMRVGGIDVLHAGLERQTCQDFELVLVDDIWEYRAGVESFYDPLPAQGFEFQHRPPIGNDFPRNHYCRSMNTGIAKARGDIILMLVDYTYLSPGFIAAHLAAHEQWPNLVVLSPHRSVQCPPVQLWGLRGSDEHYSNAGLESYVEGLKAGAFDDLMWSIFAKPFTGIEGLPEETRYGGRDPKYDLPRGPIAGSAYFYCRSESVRSEHLLALNGFDEDLDGSHGYQDVDIERRLRHLGLEFYCVPTEEAVLVNPRPYFPHAQRERSIESNREICDTKQAQGFPRVRGISELPG